MDDETGDTARTAIEAYAPRAPMEADLAEQQIAGQIRLRRLYRAVLKDDLPDFILDRLSRSIVARQRDMRVSLRLLEKIRGKEP